MCLVSLLMMTAAYLLRSEDHKPSEYEVKAAYLYNFGRFVKWPPGAPSLTLNSFRICMIGSDPFGTALESVTAGESLDAKPIKVQRILNANDASRCRIVFISQSEETRLASLLSTLRSYPVLTVSDIRGFLDQNGMIQFVTTGDRVRFEVNMMAAEQAGLTFSSELLRVALAVRRPKGTGE